MTYCDKCLEFKPVLLSEQRLYHFDKIQVHRKKNHPMCPFCYEKSFYD